MPSGSATSVEANSQLSRTITSGSYSSTIERSPGSAARVSIRAKNSPIIAALAPLDAVLRELGHERHPLLGRWVADGANGSPVRSTFAWFWRCAATSTSWPAASPA